MAIRWGNLPTDLAILEIGPVSHARWLTTTICQMWVSKCQLHKSDYKKLKMMVEFYVGVFILSRFIIKIKSNRIEGPWHILVQLKLLQS